jgi:hypothetical protein
LAPANQARAIGFWRRRAATSDGLVSYCVICLGPATASRCAGLGRADERFRRPNVTQDSRARRRRGEHARTGTARLVVGCPRPPAASLLRAVARPAEPSSRVLCSAVAGAHGMDSGPGKRRLSHKSHPSNLQSTHLLLGNTTDQGKTMKVKSKGEAASAAPWCTRGP